MFFFKKALYTSHDADSNFNIQQINIKAPDFMERYGCIWSVLHHSSNYLQNIKISSIKFLIILALVPERVTKFLLAVLQRQDYDELKTMKKQNLNAAQAHDNHDNNRQTFHIFSRNAYHNRENWNQLFINLYKYYFYYISDNSITESS